MDIVQMSLSASVLIVAVAIIRAITLHKLPKKTFLVLWGVVLCRLLIPFSIPSRFSFYTGIDTVKHIFAERTAVSSPAGMAAIPNMANIPGMGEAIGGGAPAVSISPIEIVWLIGMCACALFFIVTYIKCHREFKMALPAPNDFAARWLREHSLRRPVQIRQSDRIKAPLTYGIFCPVILLPRKTDWMDETKLCYMLTHEFTHIRRFDTLTKLVLAAAVCVHWFNPFVWAMYTLANRDIELSCDETVVRTFGETVKSAYASMLVSMEETKSGLMPLVNHFSKNAIEERIVSIMKIKKPSFVGVLLALALVIGTTTVFATNAASAAAINTTKANYNANYVGAAENLTTDFSQYKEYGLIYDKVANKLTYQGKLVRYFEDFYPLEEGNQAGIDFFDKDGIIDVHAIRDLTPAKNSDGSINPAGKLVGLEQSSQGDFDSRDISRFLNPTEMEAISADSSSGTPADGSSTAQELSQRTRGSTSPNNYNAYSSEGMITPDELAKVYAVYEPFGLTYNKKQNCLYYDGKLVREFIDILSSNGEALESGKFKGSMRQFGSPDGKGEVDIKAVRDYTKLNADGEGELIGIEVVK